MPLQDAQSPEPQAIVPAGEPPPPPPPPPSIGPDGQAPRPTSLKTFSTWCTSHGVALLASQQPADLERFDAAVRPWLAFFLKHYLGRKIFTKIRIREDDVPSQQVLVLRFIEWFLMRRIAAVGGDGDPVKVGNVLFSLLANIGEAVSPAIISSTAEAIYQTLHVGFLGSRQGAWPLALAAAEDLIAVLEDLAVVDEHLSSKLRPGEDPEGCTCKFPLEDGPEAIIHPFASFVAATRSRCDSNQLEAPIPLEICCLERVARFQVGVTFAIYRLVSDLAPAFNPISYRLWPVLANQLKLGPPAVKVISLQAATVLAQHFEVPRETAGHVASASSVVLIMAAVDSPVFASLRSIEGAQHLAAWLSCLASRLDPDILRIGFSSAVDACCKIVLSPDVAETLKVAVCELLTVLVTGSSAGAVGQAVRQRVTSSAPMLAPILHNCTSSVRAAVIAFLQASVFGTRLAADKSVAAAGGGTLSPDNSQSPRRRAGSPPLQKRRRFSGVDSAERRPADPEPLVAPPPPLGAEVAIDAVIDLTGDDDEPPRQEPTEPRGPPSRRGNTALAAETGAGPSKPARTPAASARLLTGRRPPRTPRSGGRPTGLPLPIPLDLDSSLVESVIHILFPPGPLPAAAPPDPPVPSDLPTRLWLADACVRLFRSRISALRALSSGVSIPERVFALVEAAVSELFANPAVISPAMSLCEALLGTLAQGDLAPINEKMLALALAPWTSHVSDPLSYETRATSLRVLSNLPGAMGIVERATAIRSAITHCQAAIRVAGLQAACVLVRHSLAIGSAAAGFVDAEQILFKAVVAAADDAEHVVQEAAARAFGALACLINGDCEVPPSSTPCLSIDEHPAGDTGFVPQCNSCDSDQSKLSQALNLPEASRRLAELSSGALSFELWAPFERLLDDVHPVPVRVEALDSFRRLFRHTGCTAAAKDITQRIFNMTFKDADRDVRLAGGFCLPVIAYTQGALIEELGPPSATQQAQHAIQSATEGIATKVVMITQELERAAKAKKERDDKSWKEAADQLETAVYALGVLASAALKRPSGKTLGMYGRRLVRLLSSEHMLVSNAAADTLWSMANLRGQSISDFVLEQREWIFSALFFNNSFLDTPRVAENFVSVVGGHGSLREYLVANAHHIFPVVMRFCVEGKSDDSIPIQLARVMGRNVGEVICENTQHILSYLLINAENLKEMDRFLQFMQDMTSLSPNEILRAKLSDLTTEVVLFLGDESPSLRDRALRGLRMIATSFTTAGSSRALELARDGEKARAAMQDFLVKQHLSIIYDINGRIRPKTSGVSTAEKVQALRALAKTLEYIGDRAETFASKVLATITLAFRQAPYPVRLAGAHCLKAFAERIPPEVLGPILGQLVVNALPTVKAEAGTPVAPGVETAGGVVLEVLRYLIVDRLETFKGHFADIPPVDESIAGLEPVVRVLREHGKQAVGTDERVELLVRCTRHENPTVRCMALEQLAVTLEGSGAPWILGQTRAEALDDRTLSLIDALLKACSDGAQAARPLAARCLGLVGAVDPARVGAREEEARPELEATDGVISSKLITDCLARILRSAESTSLQDGAAAAIQHILPHMGVTQEVPQLVRQGALGEGPGRELLQGNSALREACEWWNSLADEDPAADITSLIEPYISSKYSLKDPKLVARDHGAGPMFTKTMPYKLWMYKWSARLTTLALGRRAQIFQACVPVLKDDLSTARFALPYLVHNVVGCGSDEARDAVLAEVVAVLKAEDADHACLQTIFGILDQLTRWLEKKRAQMRNPESGKDSARASARKGAAVAWSAEEEAHVRGVGAFLESVPRDALAFAAYRVKAHARAFLCYESFLRGRLAAKAQRDPEIYFARGGRQKWFEDAELEFLQKVYASVDDPDITTGIAALRPSRSLADCAFFAQEAGDWTQAFGYYEQMMKAQPERVDGARGMLKCLRRQGNHWAVTMQYAGLTQACPAFAASLAPHALKSATRLAHWDRLPEILDAAPPTHFDAALGRALLAFVNEDKGLFQKSVQGARAILIPHLSGASMESYERAYPLVLKLHALRELEEAFALRAEPSPGRIGDLVATWASRLDALQPTLKSRERLLSVRRIALEKLGAKDEAVSCLLRYAKAARKAGQLDLAGAALRDAASTGARVSELLVERAKLRRLQGAVWEALADAKAVADAKSSEMDVSAQLRAKASLLYARWSFDVAQEGYQGAGAYHKKAADLFGSIPQRFRNEVAEKQSFYFGRMCDSVLEMGRTSRARAGADRTSPLDSSTAADMAVYLYQALSSYFHSLTYGCRFLFRTLPRILTLYFDYAEAVSKTRASDAGAAKQQSGRGAARKAAASPEAGNEGEGPTGEELRRAMSEAHKIVGDFSTRLAPWQWYTVFSQLLSRLCTPNDEALAIAYRLVTRVLQGQPEQALWQLLPAIQSKQTPSSKERSMRCERVMREALQASAPLQKLQRHMSEHIAEFIAICSDKDLSQLDKGQKAVALTQRFSRAWRLFKAEGRGEGERILLPILANFTVKLPAPGPAPTSARPFADTRLVYLHSANDKLEIMSSMMRPRKLTVVGDDGKSYSLLCKREDKGDMRKDSRMTEFNDLLNRLFAKHPDSRRRKLRLRTYAVTPLNEETGLLEWVPFTTGIRQVLGQLYDPTRGFGLTNMEIRKRIEASGKQNITPPVFVDIRRHHPPVFYRWFLQQFPEPGSWFQARLTYARSCAVWSMVGYVVGLGDRHGENILLDTGSGECVHVDLACLFDKAKTLAFPERVPFRLTHNMVDALGLAGTEGTFRAVCELAVGLLRENRETLLTVVDAVAHDPFVDWYRKEPDASDQRTSQTASAEELRERAGEILAMVEQRLRGVHFRTKVDVQREEALKKKEAAALASDRRSSAAAASAAASEKKAAAPARFETVASQVQWLIQQATDDDNLGNMYTWWMPWT